MEGISHVPEEIVELIPVYSGNPRTLGYFIKKCEYVLSICSGDGNKGQMTYLFHLITTRLEGEAVNLVESSEGINSWSELKGLLTLNFKDRRTEDNLAEELKNLKINTGENYVEFFKRIQQTQNDLLVKVSETYSDPNMKLLKRDMYDHTAYMVFLFNLPLYLSSWVRMRNAKTLEQALEIVLEEQHFLSRK